MKTKTEFRIVIALDLSLQSGRERLDGFYRYADRKGNWEVLIVPNVEEQPINALLKNVNSQTIMQQNMEALCILVK